MLSYKLEKFEGPLDLLLHLIEKNKVSIYDIPIFEITNQYMEYVNAMEEEDLDIVSDFLECCCLPKRMKMVRRLTRERNWWPVLSNTRRTKVWVKS